MLAIGLCTGRQENTLASLLLQENIRFQIHKGRIFLYLQIRLLTAMKFY